MSAQRPRHRFVHVNLTVAAAAFGLLGGLTIALARHVPSERDLSVILTSPQIQVDARDLKPGARDAFAQHAVCRCGLWLGTNQIPQILKQALLAQEDTRFYIHRGIDWIGLGRAFVSVISGGSIQGGSTLTQQLVKNLITGNARSGLPGVVRKVREAIIARRIERVMTKEEILTAYLNQMDFGATEGSAAIGVEQATRKYFGKPVKDLNLYEAAMLVGTLRATSAYNPTVNPGAAGQQARVVLQKMLNQSLIGENDYSGALRQTIQSGSLSPITIAASYYLAWARTELGQIAEAQEMRGRVRFVVGLNGWYQLQGDAAIKKQIARNEDRHVSQGALVALDGDGRVSALVGGADFALSQFDRATQAMRQPGSAFKLFVYVAAIKTGLDPNSVRSDAPISVGDWTPANADHQFLGPITLMKAFARSRNTVATLLGREVGIDAVSNEAHELGIRSPLGRDPSLVLGTSEVTLLELTSAYVPFMNEGRPVRPYAARLALDSSGRVVYRHDLAPKPTVLNGRTVQAMRDMLRAVVTEGTGQNARLRDLWSAGKTGTSQGNRDAWFIGFTDHVTTGIWFGNDDNSQMTGVSGADMPALAWRKFNEAITAPPGSGVGARPPPAGEAAARALAPVASRRNPESKRWSEATAFTPASHAHRGAAQIDPPAGRRRSRSAASPMIAPSTPFPPTSPVHETAVSRNRAARSIR
jgi:penicillin-binding protein 1A